MDENIKTEPNSQPSIFPEMENKEEKSLNLPADGKDKKIKNLWSAVILLAGLFIGSLFVDMGQIIKGGGYSQKNLNKSEIFEANGKTWVAYDDPAVPVSAITDENCVQCDPGEVLVWLKKVFPTIGVEKVNFDSDKGKQLISQFKIKTLPAFIFGKSVENTSFFEQAKTVFQLKDSQYMLDNQQLGIPAGKYLELPQVNEGDATFGNAESKVKVIVFSDFQCPYCKTFYTALRGIMKDYQDKALFDFKELPLEMHAQAEPAALASQCALEQGKFWEYADKLYENQSAWGNTKDTSKFKEYARTLGLDAAKFNQCLDSKKFQDKINADKAEANNLGISGTPAVFVGDQFEAGAVTADQLKTDIDAQLNK